MLILDPQMTFTELFDPHNHLSVDICHPNECPCQKRSHVTEKFCSKWTWKIKKNPYGLTSENSMAPKYDLYSDSM